MGCYSDSEIKALITLLGDEDPAVHDMAWGKLLSAGQSARRHLEQVAFSDSEGRVRIEAQAILEEIRLETLAQRFEQVRKSSILDLEHACFVLAEIEYPEIDVNRYIAKIERLALEASQRIYGVHDERRQVQKINRLLFRERGFRGNTEFYFDPENSYMNKVLDRCLGIPISLSALYLFIARRLDLPIHGVGFPGHFLLKCECSSGLFYIDAFNAGKILTENDCKRYLTRTGYAFYDSYLAVSTPNEVLARMIRNLVLIYHQSSQKRKIDTLEKIFSQFFMQPDS